MQTKTDLKYGYDPVSGVIISINPPPNIHASVRIHATCSPL